MSDRYEEQFKTWWFEHCADEQRYIIPAGAALLRRVAEAAQQPIRAEEQYWRHDVVTTRLCPVDHTKPHVSHDCVAKIESELSAAREQVRRLREAGSDLLHQLSQGPHHYDTGTLRAALAETAQPASGGTKQLESMLNDCLTVMAASDDHRERMLAQQMRIALREGKVPG